MNSTDGEVATLTPLRLAQLFFDGPGANVAVDARGNVYIAAGQILVFDPSGKHIETIKIPQRPICLIFGGRDRGTLFIMARSSLYKIQTRFAGLSSNR